MRPPDTAAFFDLAADSRVERHQVHVKSLDGRHGLPHPLFLIPLRGRQELGIQKFVFPIRRHLLEVFLPAFAGPAGCLWRRLALFCDQCVYSLEQTK